MAKNLVVNAVDQSTIQITLPDGLSVRKGQPVPVEVLDMIAAFAKLQEHESGGPVQPAWCVGGCGVQA